MAGQLSTKEVNVLLKNLQSQGCVIKEVKKGYLVLFANGESTTFHRTPSDVRAVRNLRAHIIRNGITWPL